MGVDYDVEECVGPVQDYTVDFGIDKGEGGQFVEVGGDRGED